jgi:hypothetical protein
VSASRGANVVVRGVLVGGVLVGAYRAMRRGR